MEVSEADKRQEEAMRGAFKKVSGADMEIDAYELQDILNAAFKRGRVGSGGGTLLMER